jgi:hypothetical protein
VGAAFYDPGSFPNGASRAAGRHNQEAPHHTCTDSSSRALGALLNVMDDVGRPYEALILEGTM